MRLVCLSDIHSDRSAMLQILESAGPADVLVLAGDLTHFGEPADAELIVRLATDACDTVLAVAGNCDSRAIDDRLSELGVSLMRSAVVRRDVAFYGLSAMPIWLRSMYEMTEGELAEALREGRQQLDGVGEGLTEVIVAHPPPRDCRVDRTGRGEHVGSTALREWIGQVTPSLVICGHIHEARGTDRIGPTRVVNCGPAFKGFYAVVNLGETIEVELREV
jgi:Icc-related predicted phosphoesterase